MPKKKRKATKKSARKPARKAAEKAPKRKATKARRAAPKRKAAKPKSKKKRKPNAAFMKPLRPSPMLALVIGPSPQPRTQVTKKIWDYIKKHKLQDNANRRMINADEKLKPVFGGKKKVSMFEMTKLVSRHLK
jgi:upstream activation factor subunit UAF30